ncbi:MAG: hypothetical protein KKA75_05325 [Proteobacteria bacterium]|nr:hypothetical protein [Pseudomonadota bacterium]
MTKQTSFSKYEQKVLPNFRQKIGAAESTEDVKKFFVYTIQELFESIFAEKIDFEYEDIELTPGKEPYYLLSKQLVSSNEFKSAWNDSDLPRLLSRLAETAVNRYKHLKKGPEKTDSKIRM